MPAAFVSCAAIVFGSGVDSSVIRLGERAMNGARLTPQIAEYAVGKYLTDVCGAEEARVVQIYNGVQCRQIDPRESLTLSCVVYARLGYFIVHQDIMGNINAFANRWD